MGEKCSLCNMEVSSLAIHKKLNHKNMKTSSVSVLFLSVNQGALVLYLPGMNTGFLAWIWHWTGYTFFAS